MNGPSMPGPGAACWAALKVAKKLGKGKRVVVILPDTGERYFSMDQYFEKPADAESPQTSDVK